MLQIEEAPDENARTPSIRDTPSLQQQRIDYNIPRTAMGSNVSYGPFQDEQYSNVPYIKGDVHF